MVKKASSLCYSLVICCYCCLVFSLFISSGVAVQELAGHHQRVPEAKGRSSCRHGPGLPAAPSQSPPGKGCRHR
ncbi:hypothetical protein F0562_018309 [Nyssa sinensis]|uniref:Uncharacterized protein n=1 Tax=Nyssa sinensis TaxID=561372 RepID=A0A5J4Z9P6_9ASTE|nr:hypothetical protein F0562_018309 [Nyssa sinensis]